MMLGLSWPLWVGDGAVPRVPFVAGMPRTSPVVARLMCLGLGASVLMTGFSTRWRAWYALSLGLFAVSWAQDQHRFQPWSYQYAMTGLLIAWLPRGSGVRYAGWWFASLYTHSALSKFDASFCGELGLRFIETAVRPFGLDPSAWPAGLRVAAVLAMPVFELAVAVALAFPGSKRIGLAGTTALHLSLIAVLGPAGLGHSAIVLVWNAAILAEVWAVFSAGTELAVGVKPGGGLPAGLARVAFWASVLLPVGERWGVFDAWPSHALYASHVERLTVDLHESEVERYPESVRRHLLATGDGPWRRLDLTGWSRDERGTPAYPQNRAGLGLAEGLAARYGGRGLVRVTLHGPAERWTGRRPRTELIGLDAIRRWSVRYRLNAHPAT